MQTDKRQHRAEAFLPEVGALDIIKPCKTSESIDTEQQNVSGLITEILHKKHGLELATEIYHKLVPCFSFHTENDDFFKKVMRLLAERLNINNASEAALINNIEDILSLLKRRQKKKGRTKKVEIKSKKKSPKKTSRQANGARGGPASMRYF